MDKPYLSIVVVGRNDNYGGDFTERFQNCIDWNTRWLEKYRIHTEIIMVNWNPIEDKPQLTEQLNWSKDNQFVKYRIIDVPNSIHRTFDDESIRDKVPLYEFIAKNVGIRRTKGDYVLCINADVLIHPSIVKTISQQRLTRDKYYRADRWDYSSVTQFTESKLYAAGIMLFAKGFRYPLNRFTANRFFHKLFQRLNWVRLQWNLWKEQNKEFSNRYGLNVVYDNGGYLAHCHASGDFMLTARDNWFMLQGYPEYTSISTHTDSLFTVIAYSRLQEIVFSDPVFHQAHQRRYEWSEIQNSEKFKKAYALFEEVSNLVKNKESITEFLNDETWGLGNLALAESKP